VGFTDFPHTPVALAPATTFNMKRTFYRIVDFCEAHERPIDWALAFAAGTVAVILAYHFICYVSR
jgi:hypothetical protein